MKKFVLIALMALVSLSAFCQSSQQEYPLGWAYLRSKAIKEIVPTKGSGSSASLVFSGKSNTNEVYKVYYIEENETDDSIYHHPAEVTGLIYHNLGEDKEFLGVKLLHHLYHDKTNPNKSTGYMYREVKLEDDISAQYLLDFRTDDTKWVNKTDITFEVTNSPRVMVPEVY